MAYEGLARVAALSSSFANQLQNMPMETASHSARLSPLMRVIIPALLLSGVHSVPEICGWGLKPCLAVAVSVVCPQQEPAEENRGDGEEKGTEDGSAKAGDSDIPSGLLTVAESSQYTATSRSDEVDRFLDLCDERAGHVSVVEFGRTALDRPMRAMVFANPPWSESETEQRPVAMLLGNIHSGECDGKEALLMLARELTLDPAHPWLQKMVIVMVPNYNADANDQMAVDNRAGQIGPAAGMGRRETSQGFDLNRDFMKLDSPEAQSLVRLIDSWDPHLFIDCHTTNGSRHRYQLTYDVPHNPAVPSPLRRYLRERVIPAVSTQMKQGGRDTFYYGNFDRRQTRWDTYGFEPRYSTEYAGLRGRLGILSESYSYIGYKERIFATRAFVSACLDYLAANAAEVCELVRTIDEQWSESASKTPGRFDLPLDAVMTKFPEPVTILAWKGDSDEPADLPVEFWGDYRETTRTSLPYAYLYPAELERVTANLRNHGIQLEFTAEGFETEVQFQTVQAVRRSPQPFQKHSMVRLQTNLGRERRRIPAGTVVVRTAQPLGRLAMWLLEPQSADGLVTWNFFDDRIEQGTEFPVLRLEQPLEIPVQPKVEVER